MCSIVDVVHVCFCGSVVRALFYCLCWFGTCHSSPWPTALTSPSRSVHLRSGMGYKVGVNQLKHLEVVWLSGYIFSPHFAVQMACLHECRLLLISFHDNKLFSFTEMGNVMFMLPWVDEKFTVRFTMSNVNGCIIYMHIGFVVHSVQPNHFHALPSPALPCHDSDSDSDSDSHSHSGHVTFCCCGFVT